MEKDLTVQEAYLAMVFYLENLYKLTKSDDLGGFLGDLLFDLDGGTMDPAAWADWLDAVKKVQSTPLQELIEENTVRFS